MLHSPGNVLRLTAPVGGVTAGVGVLVGDIFAIAMMTESAGATFSGLVAGVVQLTKVSAEAWTLGQKIYWDDTAKNLTSVSSGNTFVGLAVVAAPNPSAIGYVRLGAVGAGGGGGGTPAGSDGAVQVNDGGAFGGDADLLSFDAVGLSTPLLVVGHNGLGPLQDWVAGLGGLAVVSDGGVPMLSMESGNAVGSGGNIEVFGHRGSLTSLQASQDGDRILTIAAVGVDATAIVAGYGEVSRMHFAVDGTPGSGTMPGRLEFFSSDATLGSTERLRIDSKGGVTLVEEFANGADPAAPTSGGRLYCVQTVGGKTQLAVRFPSGAAQIIATEP
jgi:predicted RecA/RadA family phage recombinase